MYGETGTLVGPVRLELPGVAKSAWSFQIWNVLPVPAPSVSTEPKYPGDPDGGGVAPVWFAGRMPSYCEPSW